jgi:hypothetical protein
VEAGLRFCVFSCFRRDAVLWQARPDGKDHALQVVILADHDAENAEQLREFPNVEVAARLQRGRQHRQGLAVGADQRALDLRQSRPRSPAAEYRQPIAPGRPRAVLQRRVHRFLRSPRAPGDPDTREPGGRVFLSSHTAKGDYYSRRSSMPEALRGERIQIGPVAAPRGAGQKRVRGRTGFS